MAPNSLALFFSNFFGGREIKGFPIIPISNRFGKSNFDRFFRMSNISL
jgi:hypothetical protein